MSFDEAWSLVTLYKKYKDTDSIVDYVEGTPKSGYTLLRVEVENLVKETIALRTSKPATPLLGRSAALSGQCYHNHGKFIFKGEGKWSCPCPGLRSYRSYGSEVTG